jgi:parallel beta-helix repeat protein
MLCLFAVLAPVSPVAAKATYVGEQTLWKDTTWEGEIVIDGVLTVAPGVTLSISPGTLVSFTFRDTDGDGIGENEMFIQGILKANGSAEAPIRFTAADEARAGVWGAINVMMSEEENVLAHCIVEYGYRGFHAHFASAVIRNSTFRHNLRGLQFQESTVSLKSSRIVDNRNGIQFRNSKVSLSDVDIFGSYWGLRGVYNELTMESSRIEGNLINGVNLRDSSLNIMASYITDNRKGLYLQRSKVTLVDSLLGDNSEHGLYLEDSEGVVSGNRISGNGRAGIRALGFSGEIVGNDLSGNGVYGLQNDGAGVVNAPSNWWGTAEMEQITTLIRDNLDRQGAGPVNANTPLNEEPAGIPAK